MAEALVYTYVAVDAAGKRVRGRVSAADDTGAFEQLKRDGLSPITLRLGAGAEAAARTPRGAISERDLAALLADLGALTRAGADIRTAFAILSARAGAAPAKAVLRALSADIAGGAALERAFAAHLPARFDFVAALIAAGEAGGDLAAGFERAADMLAARIRLADQLTSAVSYPAFVAVSTLAALGVILFFVVPSLGPLIEDASAPPPQLLAAMIGVSTFLRTHALILGGAALALAAALTLAARAGLLRAPIEHALLDGPARRTAGALVYGGFAAALGSMLAGGATVGDALRLATRSTNARLARQRLETVAAAVRQGSSLSAALDAVPAFPAAIARLAAVGEASGALGPMLARAGKLEEETALRRLEGASRILGPALIVLLGGVIGLLMAGLLFGVGQLGAAAAG